MRLIEYVKISLNYTVTTVTCTCKLTEYMVAKSHQNQSQGTY